MIETREGFSIRTMDCPQPSQSPRITSLPARGGGSISRRGFVGLAAAAIAGTADHGDGASPQDGPWRGSKKKGLGQTVKRPGWAQRLASLRCPWFYSWGPSIPEGMPRGSTFVPMIFRHGGDTRSIAGVATAAKKAGITELLGFNEPDAKDQGNMTVQQALDAWPALMETGLRLGSPGCVHPDNDWMKEFMAGVKKRGLRVDFIAIHSYGGPSAEALVRRLETIHRMFERPLWITEFAVGDWKATRVEDNRHKPDTVLRFMETVLPMLDRLDFVERYAWFAADPSSGPLGTSALFDAAGGLTPLGRGYRDA
jgi:hypothetical protein